MKSIQSHLRTTFLAGIFAVVPIAVTAFVIYKVDEYTRVISPIPFVGVLVALAAIYLVGLFVTVSIGKYILRRIDGLILKIPVLKTLYESWKHVSFTSDGGEGMFAKVVLIPDESKGLSMVGFTSGQSLPDDPNQICVFVPNAPNPINGRLFFVAKDKVIFTKLSSEEAFKLLLSTGNYLPPLH